MLTKRLMVGACCLSTYWPVACSSSTLDERPDDDADAAVVADATPADTREPPLTLDNGVPSADLGNEQTVAAGTLQEYRFVFTNLKTTHYEVAIASFPYTCGDPDPELERSYLLFDFFQNPTLPDSRVTEPGTFAAWVPSLNADGPTPEDNRVVVTYSKRGPEGGSGFLAQSGSVTVNRVTEAGIRATFDLGFQDGTMTGSFDTSFCETWPLGASIADVNATSAEPLRPSQNAVP